MQLLYIEHMDKTPRSIFALLCMLAINIILSIVSLSMNYSNMIEFLKSKNLDLGVSYPMFIILIFVITSFLQISIGIGIYFRLNWVRIIYLVFTFIGLPFSLMAFRFFEFNYDGFQKLYGLVMSLFIIYVLFKEKQWFKKNA